MYIDHLLYLKTNINQIVNEVDIEFMEKLNSYTKNVNIVLSFLYQYTIHQSKRSPLDLHMMLPAKA